MSGRLTAAALPIVVAITIAAPRTSVTADSPFETIAVHGPSLEGNLEGDSPDRRVFVYLPPGYAKEPGRRFPVVYLLHGTAAARTSGTISITSGRTWTARSPTGRAS